MKAKIFGKTDCIHCEKAKMLCSQKGIEYDYLELGKDFEMQFILEKFPGVRTFPQIIVDQKHIGGYDDLAVFLRQQT
ncbi:MAG: glutaredoxin [Candidatus Thioglobus sp.]|jgi:glutaredoxin 3|nr:glutaredoxin [Gammaproteobacteria bacterium]MDP6163386.1 glutaredoxin [Candidatus Thioglobus sp.]|tara:strand:+ start:7324 stop:7554 length:231 start_codon:yes stop_codon:yes gene_type:complete